ncbi:uncharacterized protein LOC125045508 isoform X2 [Penaeus chinensis]|uniref:uncharacterized protein LOC125045508 isoform X2 n=1 Tax=Penaeus chinensis TaxID=139456 RepID=UPI001FB5F5BE|nr:uncharacterized protein LOC125045508 isoform X2 [Penaeus chinensis]
MMRVLILLAAVAAASALLEDLPCEGAKNVTSCEADRQVCQSILSAGEDARVFQDIMKRCFSRNGYTLVDNDGILVFDNPIIDNPTNSENVQAAEDCVLKERGLLTPDGRVDPEPFLERLILALNVTRPDIVNRVSYAVTSCPLENFGEWETCIVSECLQKDPAMPVPTTIDPEE